MSHTAKLIPFPIRFLTIAEAAAALELSRRFVSNEVRSGAIKGVKFGRAIRVPSTEVDKWLDIFKKVEARAQSEATPA